MYVFIVCCSAKKGKTPPATPTPAKLLPVEKVKDPLAPLGQLNPTGTKDKGKRKSVTAASTARDDETFQPVQWSFVVEQEEIEVDEEVRRPRDGREIIIREGDLADEFQVKYVGISDMKLGKINEGEHYYYSFEEG